MLVVNKKSKEGVDMNEMQHEQVVDVESEQSTEQSTEQKTEQGTEHRAEHRQSPY